MRGQRDIGSALLAAANAGRGPALLMLLALLGCKQSSPEAPGRPAPAGRPRPASADTRDVRPPAVAFSQWQRDRYRALPNLLLEGKVVDPAGKPVAAAVISGSFSWPGRTSTFGGPEIAVEENGHFEVRLGGNNVPVSMRVAASARGYSGALEETVQPHGSPGYHPIVLALRPAMDFTVRVLDGSRAPIPSAKVAYKPRSWERQEEVVKEVDASGTAVFSGADDRSFPEVRATAPGYLDGWPTRVDLKKPWTEVYLYRGGPLRGRIVDRETGAPVAGCKFSESYLGRIGGQTGADGTFVLDGQRFGEISLSASCPGYGRDYDHPEAKRFAFLESQAAETVELRWQHNQVVTGRVVDDGGVQVPNAKVVREYVPLDPEGRPRRPREQFGQLRPPRTEREAAQTDSRGEFRFADSSMAQFDIFVEDGHGREPTYVHFAALPKPLLLHWHGAALPAAGALSPPPPPIVRRPPPEESSEAVLLHLKLEDESGGVPPDFTDVRYYMTNRSGQITRRATEGRLDVRPSELHGPVRELDLELRVPGHGRSQKAHVTVGDDGLAHPDHVTLRLRPAGKFTVHVADEKGRPLAGVAVGVDRGFLIEGGEESKRPLLTDERGTLVLSEVDPDLAGPHNISVRKDGLVPDLRPLTPEELRAGQASVVMSAGVTFRVTVTDQEGQPLEGVEVSVLDVRLSDLWHSVNDPAYRKKTDSRGEVIFSHVPVDRLQINATGAHDRGLGYTSITAQASQDKVIIRLPRLVHVVVHVVDWWSKAPLAGAQFTNMGSPKSDKPGLIESDAMPGWPIKVYAPGYENSVEELMVPANASGRFEARVALLPRPADPSFPIRGHLADAQGRPMPRATVCYYASPNGGARMNGASLVVTTDDKANFSVLGITRDGIEFCDQTDEKGRYYIPGWELDRDRVIKLRPESLPERIAGGGVAWNADGLPLANGHLKVRVQGRRAFVRADLPREISSGCTQVNTDSRGRFDLELARGNLTIEGCSETPFDPIPIDTRRIWPGLIRIDLLDQSQTSPPTRLREQLNWLRPSSCEVDSGP